MISVLGYELQRASALLEQEGWQVETEEVRSRKGLLGNECRVVREQVVSGEGQKRMRLTFAMFKTIVE